MIAPWYALAYAKLERIAMRHGYALTIHGSMQRDLDLVAIPWTTDADEPEKLLKAIDNFIYYGVERKVRKGIVLPHPTKKPHGRIAYAFSIGHEGHYLDVSVMPIEPKCEECRRVGVFHYCEKHDYPEEVQT